MSILSVALIGVFALLTISHLVLAYFRIVKRRPGYSTVPLLNGFIGAAGFALSTAPRIASLWWVPFLVDWGCLPLVIELVAWRLMMRTKGPTGS